ncbi:hypothetical protein M404DRAFT_100789, partial [Pisolithus tinctorius Marx 270]
GNRCHIPETMKEQWVKMSTHMSSREIAKVTGYSQWTVNCVLHLSHQTGSVVKKPLESGCPHSLTVHDVHYLISCIKCTPDSYLNEL